jgi:hypothetical protein
MDEQCWVEVAIRGIIATVLYALHLRERQSVELIGWWSAVLWQLRDDKRVTELVSTVLTRTGHDLSRTAGAGDPGTECLRWLTRTWDPSARLLLSPHNGGARLDHVRWAAPLGVSEIACTRHSFETAWRLAA